MGWLLLVTGVVVAPIRAPTASAVDRPIAAVKFVVRASVSAKKVTFVSKDPSFLFPAIGSADDPALVGATIELFSTSANGATLTIPSGSGAPGWKTMDAAVDAYRFNNSLAPGGPASVRMAVVKQGRVLKFVAKDVAWPLAGPLGNVGVRITIGSLRNCALFDAATIRLDVAGRFVARGADVGSLVDCSDVALGGTTTTTTNPGPPVCGNGVVDVGEQCDLPDLGGCPDLFCGAAGTPAGCQCCAATATLLFGLSCASGLPCCDADDQCLRGPDNGTCISTLCGSSGQFCSGITQCEGGLCCVPLHPTPPATPPLCQGQGVSFPCCGAAVCAKPSGVISGGLECCLPADAPCTSGSECCTGSCNAAGTCDP